MMSAKKLRIASASEKVFVRCFGHFLGDLVCLTSVFSDRQNVKYGNEKEMCNTDIDACDITYTINVDAHIQLPAAMSEISFMSEYMWG